MAEIFFRPKLNLISPINQLGYGIVGLNVLKALSKRYPVALWPIGQAEAHPKEHQLIKDTVNRATFFNTNSPCLRIWHQFDMAMHVGKGIHAGFPIFELDSFNPTELHNLSSLDHIFVTSKWAVDILAQFDYCINKDKITVAPLGVDTEIFLPKKDTLYDKKNTVFLNIGKWEVRKGHDFLLEAFNKAFKPEDDVLLLMNCHNPFGQQINEQWKKMYSSSPMSSKIIIIEDRLETQEDVCNLMNSVDVGVFPSRAEGWNLELLEMMACGKKVIATNYSGHTEFANQANCNLININSTEPAYDGIWFKGQGNWAELGETQMDQLVNHMRTLHQFKQSGGDMYNEEGVKTGQCFSWDVTAEKITGVLFDEANRD